MHVGNPIRRALAEGRPSLGSWSSTGSTTVAELLGKAGLEWVVFDLQHGAPTWDSLGGLLQAAQAGGAASLVRLAWNEPAAIMRAVDLGAAGVIVPMVSSGPEAEAAGAAVRYPPAGLRSYGPLRGSYRTVDEANDDVVCLVMVETAEALDHLDAIAAAPGVDGLFVGPVDLALSLGLGLDLTGMHPDVLAAIDTVVAACRRHGKVAGTLAFGHQAAEELLGRGIRFLSVGSDVGHLMAGVRRDVAQMAQWTTAFSSASSAGAAS